MTDKPNRREDIIAVASELFMEQGYNVTSIQQIADAVGVTKAALYYHFASKRDLLQAVIECNLPDFVTLTSSCGQVNSVSEFIHCFGGKVIEFGPDVMNRKVSWILREFSNLNEDEKALFQNKFLAFQDCLKAMFMRFVPDEKRASHLSWMLQCALLGYGQIFWHMEMNQRFDLTPEDYIATLAEQMSILRL